MGVFSRIERRLEHGVGSAFARMFKGKVHPAEIARALQQDADNNATRIGKGRTLVPNRYLVRLGDTDYDHLIEWERQLTRSLADICREHFTSEGYSTHGAVKISFARDDELRTGVFEIESKVDDAEPSVPLREHVDQVRRTAPPAELRSTQYLPPAAPPAPPRTPPARPAPPRYRHLLVVDGPNDRLHLQDGRTIIGRGSSAEVRIADNGISRDHAEIIINDAIATITDLHSTNGTMVNGKRINRASLRHGDVIRVGRSVLVYRYEPEDQR